VALTENLALCASIASAVKAPPIGGSRAALPSKRAAIAVPPLSVAIHPLRIEGPGVIAEARLEGEGLAPAEVFFRFPANVADPAVLEPPP
jgi:hypothetical protein